MSELMWIKEYKFQFAVVLSIFLFGVLTFWKSLSLNFLADDYIWLVEARKTTVAELVTYFTVADGFFYRPTTKLYFWTVYQVFGANALAFHVLNLLVHILNAMLVYAVARKIFDNGVEQERTLKAWIVAVIFLVHPVHLEPTVWVSGITELLPATGILLSLLLVFRRDREKKVIKLGNTLCLGLLYFLAVGAHEYAIVLPVVLFVWQVYWNLTPNLWAAVVSVLRKEKGLYIILGFVGLAYLTLRFFANSHWQGGDYSYDLLVLPINIVANALAYVFLSIIGPEAYVHYAALRGYMRTNLSVVAIVALVCVFFCLKYRNFLLQHLQNKKLLCGIALYLLLLMAFLPLGNVAERYAYTASVVVYVMVVVLLERAIKSHSKVGTVLITIMLTIIIATLSSVAAASESSMGWNWKLIWGILLVINSVVIYKILVGAKLRRKIFLGLGLSIMGWGMMSYVYIVRDWHVASAEVNAFVGYFSYACDEYAYGDSVAINVNSKVRTAWVFPVGQEQAIELVCGKKISIIRI